MKKNKVYAIYKGEECLGIGTIKELADQFNISQKTICFYRTPTYKKRVKKGINRRVLVRVE
jgi:hypothetical protein